MNKYRLDIKVKPLQSISICKHSIKNNSKEVSLNVSIIGIRQGEVLKALQMLLNKNVSFEDILECEDKHPYLEVYDSPVFIYPKSGVVFTDKIRIDDYKFKYMTTKKDEVISYDESVSLDKYLDNGVPFGSDMKKGVEEETPKEVVEEVVEEVEEPKDVEEKAPVEPTPVQIVEPVEEKFKCPVEGCAKEYSTKSELTRHLKDKHPDYVQE